MGGDILLLLLISSCFVFLILRNVSRMEALPRYYIILIIMKTVPSQYLAQWKMNMNTVVFLDCSYCVFHLLKTITLHLSNTQH